MTTCKVCGTDYDESFEAYLDCEVDIIDQFEFAFYEVAPTCTHCHGQAVNYGIEVNGVFFCCPNCASQHDAINLQTYRYSYTP